MFKKRKKKNKFLGAFSLTILSLGAIVMIFPFVWAISVSLQSPGLAFAGGFNFFKPPYRFDNYITAFVEADFIRYTFNSVFIAVVAMIANVLSNSFIGFGFARYNFKGSKTLFNCVLATMMLPMNVMQIAWYIMWHKLGAIDTYIPLLAGNFFGSAFYIFLMRQSFMSIPRELYDAAIVDGANPILIFFRIYLPQVKPILITISLLTFKDYWGTTFGPLIYLRTKAKYTVSLGLLYAGSSYANNPEILIAASVISILPVLLVFLFAQKYFVQGLVSSAVKG